MKKLVMIVSVVGGLLAGCVYEDPYYRDRGAYDSRNRGTYDPYYRDRDGDGVRNRQDRYPSDPRRY
jgi:hypothetical protein